MVEGAMEILLPDWRRVFPDRQGALLVVRARHDRPLGVVALGSLTAAEQVRCASFRREADRQRCRWARVLSRLVLGRCQGADPSALRFAVDRRGRPALADGTPRFSLSHGGVWVVMAVAAVDIGVDVEPCVEAEIAAELAPRVLSAAERAWAAADPARRFTMLWTRKEALLKRSGEGLVDDMAAVEALSDRADLRSFDLGDGHLGAIASEDAIVPMFVEAEAFGV
jgi:4'-phosphopantetheinyl transferase